MTDDIELSPVEATALETQKAVEQRKENRKNRPKPRESIFGDRKPGEVIQEEVVRFLRKQDPASRDEKSRLQSLIEATFRRAVDMRSGQGKAAAELILNYGFGKPKPAEEELDAIKKGGLQVVFVERGGLETVARRELPPAPENPEPSFIDADFTEEK